MSVFTILGARGTMPASGPDFDLYGGHTTCFSLTAPGGLLIFDAGTGMQALAPVLRDRPPTQPIAIFFTHFHLDHIIALPCFKPLYDRRARITLCGPAANEHDLRETMFRLMSPPFWPVNPQESGADTTYIPLSMTPGSRLVFGIDIAWHPVAHSAPCLAYKITWHNFSVILAVDREQGPNPMDTRFASFCKNADVLIHDAQYTPDEYPAHRGWGHSTWQDAVNAAKESNARRLLLAHHDPTRTDAELEAILEKARREFPRAELASQHLAIHPGE